MLAHRPVLPDLVQRRKSADGQPASLDFDGVQSIDTTNVNHPIRCCNSESKPIEELGAAGDGHRTRTIGHYRVVNARCDGIVEVPHAQPPIFRAASSTAAVICGYAEHRQIFPLIHSRTESASVACPSAM